MANIDLMTQAQVINYYTNQWCKSRGISSRDLLTHQHIDDVIIMLRWRDTMWHMLNKSEQAIWGAYWNTVYHKSRALHKKALTKLENITIIAINRQETKLINQAKLIQRIKALKQNPYAKPVDNIAAKDTGPSHSVPWE